MIIFSTISSAFASIARTFGGANTADKMHVTASDSRLRDLGLDRHDVPASNISRVDAEIDRSRLNAWV